MIFQIEKQFKNVHVITLERVVKLKETILKHQ